MRDLSPLQSYRNFPREKYHNYKLLRYRKHIKMKQYTIGFTSSLLFPSSFNLKVQHKEQFWNLLFQLRQYQSAFLTLILQQPYLRDSKKTLKIVPNKWSFPSISNSFQISVIASHNELKKEIFLSNNFYKSGLLFFKSLHHHLVNCELLQLFHDAKQLKDLY